DNVNGHPALPAITGEQSRPDRVLHRRQIVAERLVNLRAAGGVDKQDVKLACHGYSNGFAFRARASATDLPLWLSGSEVICFRGRSGHRKAAESSRAA